jgi:DNA invertase Pin-like site-specific DNA recombinase
MTTKTTRAAVYARVSTHDQTTENQLLELRRYCEARGWTSTEYVDTICGAKDKRPGLDALMVAARRRQFDALLVWRLDRLGRSLSHLVTCIEELAALGVAFVSLNEGIDTDTPAGRLQLHLLAAIAQFERDRIRERVHAGLARARRQGKRLGRPSAAIPVDRLATVQGIGNREAASRLGVSLATLKRWRAAQKSLSPAA